MPWFDVSAVLAGLALGAASVLSIGPNNLMLVREGLVRGRVGTVATLVWSSYVALLVAAFAMTDLLNATSSPLRVVLSVLGWLWLCWFAYAALRTAIRSRLADPVTARGREAAGACFRRVAAVVWLNPLTYIEFLLVPTAVCSRFEGCSLRLQFLAGLLIMAGLGCYGYPLGGGACAHLLRHRRTLQVFDLASGLLLTAVAAAMALRLIGEAGWRMGP